VVLAIEKVSGDDLEVRLVHPLADKDLSYELEVVGVERSDQAAAAAASRRWLGLKEEYAGGDGTPSMKACKSQSAEVTLASVALALPPPIAAVRELVIVATPATPVACVARGAVAPPSPPPRG
jgi:hypothetical protein